MARRSDLREALVEAAIEVIDEQGLEALSVREVARRAGVSSGAPFRHFPDKTALLTGVAEDAMRRFTEHTEAAMAGVGPDPLTQFQALGVAFVRFAVEHPAHFRVMFRPDLGGPALDELREASRARFRELIVLGQAAGGLRAGDPEPIMLAAWAIVYGLARMYADGVIAGLGLAEAPPEVLAEIVTRALGQGIERPAEG